MSQKAKDTARKAKRPAREARKPARPARQAPETDLQFGSRNYMALGAALASILIGFVLLKTGSITAAPILLVLGYCVLVPYGLAAGRGRSAPAAPQAKDAGE